MVVREEAPDEGGLTVRREARHILAGRAELEAEEEQKRGAPRTRGAILTRGAVRPSGAVGSPAVERSARAILLEIEDLEAANPGFRTAVRTR
jgi:hypothetical protein